MENDVIYKEDVMTRAVGTRTEADVTYVRAGNILAYSDNPESFSLVPGDIHYLWGGTIGTSPKDIEMYHHLYNGWNDDKAIGAGVAIKNGNSFAITITYKYAFGAKDSSSDTEALTVTPGVLANFLNASTKTVSVPANSIVKLDGVVTNFTKAKAKFISYRGQIKSSTASNVSYRIYVAGAQKLTAMAELFKIATPATAEKTQFCGEISYNEVRAELNAETAISTNKYYKLFKHPRNPYNGEYVESTNYKPNAGPLFAGNFGVKYTLKIKANSGRFIWIEPDWSIATRTNATILYRFNGGAWTPRSTPITKNGCWYLSLPVVNGYATVDLFLCGGNHGNFQVYFS